MGSIVARLFTEAGARVIAVSDSQGGAQNPEGIDWRQVIEHKRLTGSVIGLARSEEVSNDDLLTLPCDILIPAALCNVIRRDNAPMIGARLIVEAANGPTTPGADEILFERGIPVVPDILANAGGVTVSYFEWVQNIENEQWAEADVNEKLLIKMNRAADAVIDEQRKLNALLDDLEARRTERGLDDGPLSPVDLR